MLQCDSFDTALLSFTAVRRLSCCIFQLRCDRMVFMPCVLALLPLDGSMRTFESYELREEEVGARLFINLVIF